MLYYMKKLLLYLMLIYLASMFMGCSDDLSLQKIYEMYHQQVESVGSITDDMVVKYVNTYRQFKKNGVDYLNFIQESKDGQETAGEDAFQMIEQDIKTSGFADYAEFVKVNAKIAWAWNISQGQLALVKFSKLKDWAVDLTENVHNTALEEWYIMLEDPDLPPEMRAEIEAQLAIAEQEMAEQKQEISDTLNEEYDENMKWAEITMEYITPLTNKEDMAVIMRHEQELMEVFTGLNAEQLKEIQNATLFQLDQVKD